MLYFYYRQKEIQHLKEALILQKKKSNDLNKYKNDVYTEYQENTVSVLLHDLFKILKYV